MNYDLTSAAIGLALAACILLLVRRDRMYLGQALFWILVATAALVFGIFPRLSDLLADALGIGYAPTLVLSTGLAIVFAKALLADLAAARLERDVHALAQRLAVAEAALQARATTEPPPVPAATIATGSGATDPSASAATARHERR